MMSPLRRYFESLSAFVQAAQCKPNLYFRQPGRDFTRRRLLTFSRLVFLTLSLLKKSNSVELEQFFGQISGSLLPASKSALTQARKKLLPVFFEDLLDRSIVAFYQHFETARWKGFRLWATDGSGFRLPDAPAVGDSFGWHGNQHNRVPSARMSVCYDLLNRLVTAVRLHPREISETWVATCHVQTIPEDVLMVYDRGYGSQIIPVLHHHYGSNCIIRMPLSGSNTVKSFVSSGKREQIITEPLGQKAREWLRNLEIPALEIPSEVTCRLIRFELSTGEVEVLLTTLLDKKRYSYTHFGRIYRARWGIESCFFTLKSLLQLANFSAHLPDLCRADIYAVFIFHNLQTASLEPLKKQIRQISKDRRYEYQPNRNVSAGFLKRCIPIWFLGAVPEIEATIGRYHRLILRTLEAKRPDQSKERRRRLMRGTERHVHEKNYRRAL